MIRKRIYSVGGNGYAISDMWWNSSAPSTVNDHVTMKDWPKSCGTGISERVYFFWWWRSSLRGCDRWLTLELDPGNWKFLTFCPSLECTSCPRSHSHSRFQGHSLEKAICCWGHPDGICDWTQLRPLYKFLRIWQAGVEISSRGHPRQASSVNSLAY